MLEGRFGQPLKGNHEEILQGVIAIVRGCYNKRKEEWIASE
jgi:hypothetical protein